MPDSTGRQHSRRQIPAQKTLTGRPRPLHPSSWRDFGPQDRVEFSSSEFHCAKTAHLYSNCGDAETHRSICRLSEEKPESDSTHGWRQESFAWLKTRHGVAGSLRTSPDCDFRGAAPLAGQPPDSFFRGAVSGLAGRRTRLAVAHRAGDPLALGDGVDAIHREQLHRLPGAGRPVNLGRTRVGRVPQPEVRPAVVRRNIAAAGQHILTHAHPVGVQVHRGASGVARAFRAAHQLHLYPVVIVRVHVPEQHRRRAPDWAAADKAVFPVCSDRMRLFSSTSRRLIR